MRGDFQTTKIENDGGNDVLRLGIEIAINTSKEDFAIFRPVNCFISAFLTKRRHRRINYLCAGAVVLRQSPILENSVDFLTAGFTLLA